MSAPQPAQAALSDQITAYQPGQWFDARTIDEMQAFYLSRLPAIREAAKEHGYAIGVHGSQRRDFDLMAMQWSADASDKDSLARAIADAACGIRREGAYDWEQKPSGRVATSIPICWTAHDNPDFDNMISAGHIDLSIILAASHQPAAVPVQAAFPARDLTKPAEQQGIFEKFTVRRNDGSDTVGGKHHGCRYFVLDLDHDQHAPAAMQSYAASCRATHPLLADDIEAQFGAAPVQAAAVPDGWKQLMQFYDAANAEELVKAQEDHIAALQAKLLKLTPIQPVFTKVREG